MTTTRHLNRNDVPAHLRAGYDGRKFVAVLTETVVIPATAGFWDGGSRDQFHAICLATGATLPLPNADFMDTGARDRRTAIPPGLAIVRHSTFQGRDTGLTYFMRPEDAAPLLPAPAEELEPTQRAVLRIIRSYIPKVRMEYAEREGITADAYAAAKASLITAGLLNAAGAITTAGKNAI